MMEAQDSKRLLPHIYGIDDFDDDSLVFANGILENTPGICGCSDDFDDDDITLFASFIDEAVNKQQHWEPYRFTPAILGVSNLVLMYSGITQDDHVSFFKKVGMTEKSFIEYIDVFTSATRYLHIRTATSVLINGVSDYSEMRDGAYIETRTVTEWGGGEEYSGVINSAKHVCSKPRYIGVYDREYMRLQQATDDPNWSDVPYVKLIADNEDISI